MVVRGTEVLTELSGACADPVRRLCVLLAIIALGAAGCQGGDDQLRGVVVSIDGDLGNVTGFELVDEDGIRFQFTVDPGVEFAGLPLSHLNEHRLSADPILVVYEDRGELVAISISDG